MKAQGTIQRFPEQVAREAKRRAGRTPVALTPLAVRLAGTGLDPQTRDHIERRLSRQLGKFAPVIERSTVRIADTNAARGGIDMSCTIKVVVSGRPSVVVAQRGTTAREAFDRAASSVERTVRRQLGRAGLRAGRGERAHGEPPSTLREPNPPPEHGSLIGARVGRSAANLQDAADRPEKRRRDSLVDTAQEGVNASMRKAGGGSTARRNTKLNLAGLTSALEDSAQERPSRKSTRGSANRSKRDNNLKRRQTRKVSSPKERARRERAKSGSARTGGSTDY